MSSTMRAHRLLGLLHFARSKLILETRDHRHEVQPLLRFHSQQSPVRIDQSFMLYRTRRSTLGLEQTFEPLDTSREILNYLVSLQLTRFGRS
jgi:hypothetical protein